MARFVGEFTLAVALTRGAGAAAVPRPDIAPAALELPGLLAPAELAELAGELDAAAWVPVGVNGMKGDYAAGDRVGSLRASAYSPAQAGALWDRIAPHLPPVMDLGSVPTDTDGTAHWAPVGVNPLLRFIRYPDGGELVAHVDAPYVHHARRRTLLSLVVYLRQDAGVSGGATRFLHDPQLGDPLERRDLADWDRVARPEEVRAAFAPVAGTGLLFPHRVRHDGEPVRGGQKLLLRTDIEFERA